MFQPREESQVINDAIDTSRQEQLIDTKLSKSLPASISVKMISMVIMMSLVLLIVPVRAGDKGGHTIIIIGGGHGGHGGHGYYDGHDGYFGGGGGGGGGFPLVMILGGEKKGGGNFVLGGRRK